MTIRPIYLLQWTLWIVLFFFITLSTVPQPLSLNPLPKTDEGSLPKIEFVDVAGKAGLTARHVTGPEQSKEYILEGMGSGVALFDFNNDGFLDVFLVNGTTLEGFPKGQESGANGLGPWRMCR